MNLKMLYIGCHAVLEYDEISLFHELGIDVFCLGSYLDPSNPVDPIRPLIPGMEPDQDLIKLACPREKLTRELVDKFDVVYIMHIPEWLMNNWEVIKDKIVVWRSIGQSIQKIEDMLRPYRKNIKIVRYSPYESTIPGYIGADAMIRFYKDPDELNGWNGNDRIISTFSQAMPIRSVACSYEAFRAATNGLPRVLYGPKNESSDMSGGLLSYDEMKKVLRDSRVYFYTGTHPASYTLNFIEAWMSGIPVVAVGPRWGNAHYLNVATYEVPLLMDNGVDGFWSDEIHELNGYCEALLNSEWLARRISIAGRRSAIEIFGKDKIKPQWQEFFKGM